MAVYTVNFTPSAHQFDTGGVDRLYVRGVENVHKKLLIQAAACNLALLMRSLYGAGKPGAAHDHIVETVFAWLDFMKAIEGVAQPQSANSADPPRLAHRFRNYRFLCRSSKKRAV
jgi:hypothetical protein